MESTTIENTLISLLDSLKSNDNFAEIIKEMELNVNDFTEFLHWDLNHYTRNCIVRTEQYELLLLCWEQNQGTSIHNHNEQECWVYMLSGQMIEEQFNLTNNVLHKKSEVVLSENQITYMNDSLGYHRLKNISEGKSVSLHLYAKPIKESNVFNEKVHSFETKKMKDYSYKGRLI